MNRSLSKFAALLLLAGVLGLSTSARADDPPPVDGGQDPPHHPVIVQPPSDGLDMLVATWTTLLSSLAL